MPPNQSRRTKQTWGILSNPFPKVATELAPEEQEYVFTGRSEDLDEFCSYTNRPGGLLLYGLHGQGKTLFIERLLEVLKSRDYFCVYATYNADDGFVNSVLLAVAKILKDSEPDKWGVLYERLLGKATKASQERSVEAAGEVSGLLAKLASKAGSKQTINSEQSIANPRRWLQDSIEEIVKSGRKVIIAVDDLDNQEATLRLTDDSGKPGLSFDDIDTIVKEARQLINAGATIVLVGHPSGPTAALGSSNILTSFKLEPLNITDLVEMIERYLALGRGQTRRELKPAPFTEEALLLVARTISRLKLPTRYMLFACSQLFDYAAKNGIEVIDTQVILNHWPDIKTRLVGSLKREDINYLRIIEENGGFDEDKDEAIIKIAGPVSEFLDGLRKLLPLVNKEFLVETAKGSLVINPLLAENNPFDLAQLPDKNDMDAGV